MVIISMTLIGALIVLNLYGFRCLVKGEKKPQVDENARNNFKTVGNGSSCLGFLIYFLGLMITAFTVTNKIAVLTIIFVVLAELIEMFARFSKVRNTKNFNDMWEIISKEKYSFKYIFVEASELIIFVYLFVLLFQQL